MYMQGKNYVFEVVLLTGMVLLDTGDLTKPWTQRVESVHVSF